MNQAAYKPEVVLKPSSPFRVAGSFAPLSARDAERLRFLEESARVKRWHTEPVLHPQSVGEHTYGVMMLVLQLTDFTASRTLLLAALFHDTAERKFGDVPGPTKRLLGVKATFDELEDVFMRRLGLEFTNLTEHEQRVLKLADNLEGAMFCAFEARRGNRDIQESFRNYLNYLVAMELDGFALSVYDQLFKEYSNVFGR